MGLHRSGTTILYKMLGKTENFNILTLYHLLNYDNLLYNHLTGIEKKKKQELNELLINKGIRNRKTDNIKVTAEYEHEYVYIFSERNYPWKITPKNKRIMEELCKKIKFISENDKPILLKNPYDFANFIHISKIFPNAKFIFIHRNPLEILSSTMRLWKTRLTSKDELASLYSKQYRLVYKNPLLLFIMKRLYLSRVPLGIFGAIKRCKKGSKQYLEDISHLSKDTYVSITYEELCREPDKIITKIMDFCNLKTDKEFGSFIKPRKLSLTPNVKFLKKYIFKKMKAYFDYFDYKI